MSKKGARGVYLKDGTPAALDVDFTVLEVKRRDYVLKKGGLRWPPPTLTFAVSAAPSKKSATSTNSPGAGSRAARTNELSRKGICVKQVRKAAVGRVTRRGR